MISEDIAQHRLSQQRLTGPMLATPGEIVAWLGAVQAQDYAGAKWALGMRLRDATDDAIEQAFTAGAIVRTHVLRPTWHFVHPGDLRWMLELTAPRVNAVNAYMYRQLELDAAVFDRSNAIIAEALQGGRHLTRAELGEALAKAGIAGEGMRLGYIVHRAELDALICSGPRRGKQFTYALLQERAPQAISLPRDHALAELTRRYFTGRGPATVKDFVWWSGLTVADARAGIANAASQLSSERVGDEMYWFSSALLPMVDRSASAFLLPTYDEYLVGFSSFDTMRHGGPGAKRPLVFDSTIVIGSKVAGSWKRTVKKNAVVIDLAPFAPLAVVEERAIHAAIERYGAFLGVPVRDVQIMV